MSVNRVILLGRLGADPVTKSFQNGDQVTKFSLGVTDWYKDRDGNKKDRVEWASIVCKKRTAELAQKWLEKGSQLLVEGKLTHRSYDDKEGRKVYVTEVLATNLTFIGSKRQAKEPVRTDKSEDFGNRREFNPGYACLPSEKNTFNASPDELPF
jgi:single-strand DNA-binding protein